MTEVISIITPSFNREAVISETAESILAQTYTNWEWVIVDDGSTDNTWKLLQEFAERDSRIKIFKRNRAPKGACVCRNIAIENSTGTYLLFLDTDDVLAPYCLEQRVQAMQQQPDCDFIIFPMLLFTKQVHDAVRLWNIDKDEDDLMRILVNDPICQGTGTLWKKRTFVEIGMWREDLKIWQDMELHIRSFLWPVKYAKRLDLSPDVYLRLSNDSLSRVGYHDLPKVKSRMEVFFYAYQTIREKNLVSTYTRGLRVMGCDIGLGMIFYHHFNAANEFFDRTKELGIYTDKELSDIKNFLWLCRFRLNKIKFLDKYFYKKIASIAPKERDSVGVFNGKNCAVAQNVAITTADIV